MSGDGVPPDLTSLPPVLRQGGIWSLCQRIGNVVKKHDVPLLQRRQRVALLFLQFWIAQ